MGLRGLSFLLTLPLLLVQVCGAYPYVPNHVEPAHTSIEYTQSLLHQSKAMLHKLAGDDLNAFLGFEPQLEVLISPRPNAFAVAPNKLVLSSALGNNNSASSAELAFVIAHELGHFILGHHHKHSHHKHNKAGPTEDTLSLRELELEIEADIFAIQLLRDAGLDAWGAVRALTLLGIYCNKNGELSSKKHIDQRLNFSLALLAPVQHPLLSSIPVSYKPAT